MMESRIGALDLNVRVPETGAASLASAARAFTSRVLERCDELLEQRAPGRLVFMRQLDLEWRLRGDALDVREEVEAVAFEMARALDEDARAHPASPDENGEIAVFDDEVHYRAEYLHAVSRRAEGGWYFAALRNEGPAPGLIVRREHRVLAEAVLTRLAAKGVLADVLSALPLASIVELAESLDAGRSDVAGRDAADTGSPVRRALASFIGSARRASRMDSSASASAAGTAPLAGADIEAPDDSPAETAEIVEIFDTRFGGLFYLLSPALELSLGEALWIACVPETAVLTRVAEELLGAGATADPAAHLFAGANAGARLTAIGAEQHAEVANGLLNSMVIALARGRPTDLPAAYLRIAAAGEDRLLVATAPGSPFALFAWPANSADTLREGTTAFLASWPLDAPRPTADSALSFLDRTGRIRMSAPADPRPWILQQEDDPFATALLTQAAGSLAFLFAARAGAADVTSPAQLVERHLAVPARILVTAEEMEVRMPMNRIDLAVRRAGLDRDPGWVPWLGKRVRFSFVEDAARA